MAWKICVKVSVTGTLMLIRALAQAYRHIISNGGVNGISQEAVKNTIRRGSMTEQEARQVLGITESAKWEGVLKKYDTLFEKNAKQRNFYIQSKVHKAKECLEAVYRS